jgi:hypothetical protein
MVEWRAKLGRSKEVRRVLDPCRFEHAKLAGRLSTRSRGCPVGVRGWWQGSWFFSETWAGGWEARAVPTPALLVERVGWWHGG